MPLIANPTPAPSGRPANSKPMTGQVPLLRYFNGSANAVAMKSRTPPSCPTINATTRLSTSWGPLPTTLLVLA